MSLTKRILRGPGLERQYQTKAYNPPINKALFKKIAVKRKAKKGDGLDPNI